MIKKLALTAILSVSASPLFAASGTFGSGVELNINGTVKLFALDNGGTTRLTPTGSTATLDQTSWANGTEASPTLNLGTFNPGAGQTLTLKGGSLLTFANGGSSVTAGFLDFRVFAGIGTPSGSFTEISLPFNADISGAPGGSAGDQRWSVESSTFNLLTGLSNGTYTLGVFLRDSDSDGGHFSSNNSANYGARFTVVPEPSTLALLTGPALLGAWFYIRRRRVS